MGEIIRLKIRRRPARRRVEVSATPAAVEILSPKSFNRFGLGFDVAATALACAGFLNNRQPDAAVQFWSDHIAKIRATAGKRIPPEELDRLIANYNLALRAMITPLRISKHAGDSKGLAG